MSIGLTAYDSNLWSVRGINGKEPEWMKERKIDMWSDCETKRKEFLMKVVCSIELVSTCREVKL